MPRRRHLLRMLREHRPLDPVEARHLEQALDLVAGTAAPLSRRQFDPGHVTASAFILAADRSALLMVHHRKLARWLQPGGHVEPDDPDVLQAAIRETREECGPVALRADSLCRRPLDLDVHPIPARGAEPAHLHFDVRFLFVVEPQASVDPTCACWCPLERMSRINKEPAMRRVLRKIRQQTSRNAH